MATNYSRSIGTLRQLIANNYKREDIGRLCSVLGTDFEQLPGETKLQKVNSLLTRYAQDGQLQNLVEVLSKERPDAAWVSVPLWQEDIRKATTPTNGRSTATISKPNQLEDIKAALNRTRLNKYLTDRKTRDAVSRMVYDGIRQLTSNDKRSLLEFLYGQSYINRQNPILSLTDADFSHIDLSWLSLAGAYLCYMNFCRSDFTLANLRGADFSGSSLRGAQLKAFLVGAELVKADLREADFTQAKLVSASLAGSNMRFTNLTGADLSGANLTGVDLSFANLSNANLTNANLMLTTLKQTNLTGAITTGARFDHANLIDVELP